VPSALVPILYHPNAWPGVAGALMNISRSSEVLVRCRRPGRHMQHRASIAASVRQMRSIMVRGAPPDTAPTTRTSSSPSSQSNNAYHPRNDSHAQAGAQEPGVGAAGGSASPWTNCSRVRRAGREVYGEGSSKRVDAIVPAFAWTDI